MNPAGLSKAGLDRIHNVVIGHVEGGSVPGAVILVSQRGEVVAILMTQRLPPSHDLHNDFWASVWSMTSR
ncbi:MAG: hypothetical protein WAN93_09465 [Solirubrobacteraceae bacterium]